MMLVQELAATAAAKSILAVITSNLEGIVFPKLYRLATRDRVKKLSIEELIRLRTEVGALFGKTWEESYQSAQAHCLRHLMVNLTVSLRGQEHIPTAQAYFSEFVFVIEWLARLGFKTNSKAEVSELVKPLLAKLRSLSVE